MTRRIAISAFAACAAIWLAPGAALAAGDSGPLWPAFNLVLLLAVIVYFARNPIQEFFAGGRTEIAGKLDGAAA